MARYWIVAAVLAVISGALFKGAAYTGNPFFEMGATIGLVLVGATAIGGVVRWQGNQGRHGVEDALLTLGDSFLITDWVPAKSPFPDYLIVAPGAVVAVVLDDMADALNETRAQAKLSQAHTRCQKAVQWVEEHADHEAEVPVLPVLVLTRRKAEDMAVEGLAIVNPEHLSGHLKQYEALERLKRADQVKLTRKLRAAHDT